MNVPVRRVRATADVKVLSERPRVGATLPEGLPQLFDKNGRPIRLANEYLLTRATALIKAGLPWKNTVDALADDLAQATIFLDVIGLTWNNISRSAVERYSLALSAGYSVWTQRKRAPSTIHRRISTVIDACQFGYQKGYLSESIRGASSRPVSSIYRAAISSSEVIDDLTIALPRLRAADANVNPILSLSAILSALGPESSDAADLPRRDRLAAETTAFVGLRVDETAGLTIYQILHLADKLDTNCDWREFRLELDPSRTKGGVGGAVLIPGYHVAALANYIDYERSEVVRHARDVHGGRYVENSALFLNGIDATHRDIGLPCQPDTLSRAFTRAVIASRIFKTEERLVLNPVGSLVRDPQTRKPCTETVQRPAHTYHDLRHTFAVAQYLIRKANGDRDPLKSVQTLLRHKLSKTTADIYLRWLSVNERDFSPELSRYYRMLDQWVQGSA